MARQRCGREVMSPSAPRAGESEGTSTRAMWLPWTCSARTNGIPENPRPSAVCLCANQSRASAVSRSSTRRASARTAIDPDRALRGLLSGRRGCRGDRARAPSEAGHRRDLRRALTLPHTLPTVFSRTRAWISACEITGVSRRKRSMIERIGSGHRSPNRAFNISRSGVAASRCRAGFPAGRLSDSLGAWRVLE